MSVALAGINTLWRRQKRGLQIKCSLCNGDLTGNQKQFCSRHCKAGFTATRRDHPVKKFWKHVRKTKSCWVWKGIKPNTYGYLVVGSKFDGTWHYVRGTHFSWMLHHGRPVPKGKFVLHKCDNPPCVRPDHLFIGTQRDNVKDMMKKGRFNPGRRSPTTMKLLRIESKLNRIIPILKSIASEVARLEIRMDEKCLY